MIQYLTEDLSLMVFSLRDQSLFIAQAWGTGWGGGGGGGDHLIFSITKAVFGH